MEDRTRLVVDMEENLKADFFEACSSSFFDGMKATPSEVIRKLMRDFVRDKKTASEGNPSGFPKRRIVKDKHS